MDKLAPKSARHNAGLVGIVLLLGLIAHSSMLPASFKTLDDNMSIVNNPDIRDFAHTGKVFASSFFGGGHYYRPMVTLSFMVNYRFSGLEPFYYNLTNLMLHLSLAVTVFFLVLLIIGDRATAFLTSLLFAVHPVHWEAVGNIPGRAVLLSTFFTVNAFFFYLLAGGAKRRFAACYPLSLLFFAGGLWSKESAAVLPLVLIVFMFLAEKGKKKYLRTLPYFCIVLVYILVRLSLGITETFPWRSAHELVLGFLTFLRACLMFARVFVWPANLHFDRAQEMFLSFREPQLWATAGVFLLCAYALVKWRKRLTGPALFFLAWTAIELLPVSQLVTTIGVQPGYISAAEHFLYGPSVGVFALIALGAQKLYRTNLEKKYCSAQFLRMMAVCAAVLLILTTARQGYVAQTPLTMFRQSLAENPKNTRILFSMGLEMAGREEFEKSEHYFRRALAGEPLHASSRLGLGRALHDQGKYMEAIAVYETVKDAGRYGGLLENNLNEAYQAAAEQYRKRIAGDPDNARLHYSLGTVYSRSRRVEAGIEEYKKAVALEPGHKNALFNLASSYEALGESGWAAAYYERMLALDGEKGYLDRHACLHLGGIYRRQGEEAKAREYFKRADLVEH